MTSEKDIFNDLEQLKDNSHFKVPDNYFDSFADMVVDKLPPTGKSKKTVFNISRIRTTLTWAASLAALFFIAYAGIGILLSDVNKNITLAENDIFLALEEDIYSLDEIILFDFIQEKQPNTTSVKKQANLTEEEIIDYLIETDANMELVNEDF